MNRKRLLLLISATVIVLTCLGAFLVLEMLKHPIRHRVDDILYDNYNHYLACEDLPVTDEVRSAIKTHQDVLDAVDQLAPGIVGWQMEEICPGRGDILFWFGSHDQRNQVEALIGSEERFFGIPIRMRNQ